MQKRAYDLDAILAAGYTPTGDVFDRMPTFGAIQRLHATYDVAEGGVTAFRVSSDPEQWQAFKKPDAAPGYRASAMPP